MLGSARETLRRGHTKTRSDVRNNDVAEDPAPPHDSGGNIPQVSRQGSFWADDDSNLWDLTGIVDRDEHQWIGGGAFGDVYRGIWRAELEDVPRMEIVVKVLRCAGAIERDTMSRRMKVGFYLVISLISN